jgi:hypothetical protein
VDGAAGAKLNTEGLGFVAHSRYLLHDRDGKFCPILREVIQAGKVKPLKLPARSPEPDRPEQHEYWFRLLF